jgi:hypothetical protein
MKKILVCAPLLSGLLVLGCALTAWSAARPTQQPEPKQSQNTNRPPRPDSLRHRAQERDVEVELAPTETNAQASSVQSLKKRAMVIVIGRLTDETAYFDSDDIIVTSYKVKIQRVLKDATASWSYPPRFTPPAPLTSPLKLIRAGGEVHVNGHRATVKLAGSELLKPNKDYLLFLTWGPYSEAYRPVGGVSGFFIIENSRVKPAGSEAGVKKYEGIALQTLIDEVLKTDN